MEKITASDPEQFRNFLKAKNGALKVLFFSSEASPECNQINDVLNEFISSGDYKDAEFFMIEANKQEDVCKKLSVSSVPCIMFEWKNGSDKLVGANVPALVKMLNLSYAKAQSVASKSDPEEDLNSRLKNLINKAPCMLFMKGNPEMPRCGFSKQVIALLKSHNAKFETFDILEDNDVRQGLKTYSNWPTYPQLYINGDLIGGIDILKEMSADGELDDILPKDFKRKEVGILLL